MLSERRATNIGLLYPKVRKNIGGDIPVDVPPSKILGGCVPGIPGGVDASGNEASHKNYAAANPPNTCMSYSYDHVMHG